MRRLSRFAGLLTTGSVVALLAVAVPAGPASAEECAPPGETMRPVPWQQQLLAPERAWPFSRGGGVTVAVLDSGVDATHPQLRGRIRDGGNFVAGKDAKGNSDCSGHGTAVAGLIAAQPAADVAFHGFAPDATILPVRVFEDAPAGGTPRGAVTPAQLADAITWAVNNHAQVIELSVASFDDNPVVRAAIANALSKRVVVVAAVGDTASTGEGETRTPYPAGYDGVIGVGALDVTGSRFPSSQRGPFVDLVAPGNGVMTTRRGSGQVLAVGTPLAAALVAATAALVVARWPDLRPEEVARRLFATAAPAPGGVDSDEFGHGIVNPYAAVTDELPTGGPAALPALTPDPPSPEQVALAASVTKSTRLALLLTGATLLALLAVAGAAIAIPRGHRRRWRAGLAIQPADRREDPEPAPPVHLFEGQ